MTMASRPGLIAAGSASRPYSNWTQRFLPEGASAHDAVLSAAFLCDPQSLFALAKAASGLYMSAAELAGSIIGEPITDDEQPYDEASLPVGTEAEAPGTYTDSAGNVFYAYADPSLIRELGE